MSNANGFQTKVWGAPMWLCLHMIAMNYSQDRKHEYKQFFSSLGGVLPCGTCRDNYKRILKHILPLSDDALSCRESMSMWVFLLHNIVQGDIYNKTGIDSDVPKYKNTTADFKRASAFYERYRARCVSGSYGCTVPVKGSRKRSKIRIVRYSKPRKTNAIKNVE